MASAKLYTQRDLNCLSDPDRNTRKRALEKILQTLGVFGKVCAHPHVFRPCTVCLRGTKSEVWAP